VAPSLPTRFAITLAVTLGWVWLGGFSALLPGAAGAAWALAITGAYCWRNVLRCGPEERLCLRLRSPGPTWRWLVLALLAIAAADTGLLMALGAWPTAPGSDPNGPPAEVINLIVLSPFIEEIAFRGKLQRMLEERFSQPLAVVLTAVVFAAVHGQLQEFPSRLLAGIVYGAAICVTGSVWSSVLLHGVDNATLVAFDGVQAWLPALTAPAARGLGVGILATGVVALACSLWWAAASRPSGECVQPAR
jgi:membrane protease YdiL (CAAX protease family)